MNYKPTILFFLITIVLLNACKCKYTCDVNQYTESKLMDYAKDSNIIFENQLGKKIYFTLQKHINSEEYSIEGKSSSWGCYYKDSCISEYSFEYKSDSILNKKDLIKYYIRYNYLNLKNSYPNLIHSSFELFDYSLTDAIEYHSDDYGNDSIKSKFHIKEIKDSVINNKHYNILYQYERNALPNQRVKTLYFSPDSGFVAFIDALDNSFFSKK